MNSSGRPYENTRSASRSGPRGSSEEDRYSENQGPPPEDTAESFHELIEKVESLRFDDDGKLKTFIRDFYMEHPAVQKMSHQDAERERKRRGITVVYPKNPEDVPKPVLTFEQAAFSQQITELLQRKYRAPTPIQVQGWPIALSGHDLIGIAETGSGKTLAFILPALMHIQGQPPARAGEPIALVLAPTRELAVQIGDEAQVFAERVNINVVTIYGKMEKAREALAQLRQRAELVVACPGKLMDIVKRRQVRFHRVTYFVLDEADRLLDMGFEPQIRAINSGIRKDRQILMWSATWPRQVQELVPRVFPDRARAFHIQIGRSGKTVDKIQQVFISCNDEYEKYEKFYAFMKRTAHMLTLVFCNQKAQVDYIADELPKRTDHCVLPERLHGGMPQIARTQALRLFREKKKNCLVATEVASRGLDIDNIMQVINLDCPRDLDAYIHRVGRTGRAGREGYAVTIVHPGDLVDCKSFFQDVPRCLESSGHEVPQCLRDMLAGETSSYPTSWEAGGDDGVGEPELAARKDNGRDMVPYGERSNEDFHDTRQSQPYRSSGNEPPPPSSDKPAWMDDDGPPPSHNEPMSQDMSAGDVAADRWNDSQGPQRVDTYRSGASTPAQDAKASGDGSVYNGGWGDEPFQSSQKPANHRAGGHVSRNPMDGSYCGSMSLERPKQDLNAREGAASDHGESAPAWQEAAPAWLDSDDTVGVGVPHGE